MDWRNAAAAFPPLKEADIARLQLSKEEKEHVLTLFNRAVSNAQSDSADIAMIALKKLLTQYPSWGEAALLYGICLAIDGKYKRAGASFEHSISAGLLTEELTYLAQVCYQDAGTEYAKERRHVQADDETAGKQIFSSFFPSRKGRSSVYREIDTEERGHMQAPILTRVPRNSGKARLASDRERRDVMMQSTAPQGDNKDDEIDVSIPRTPAEKLRITIIAAGAGLLAVLVGLAIWYLIIPAFNTYRENSSAADRLSYLVSAMELKSDDPQVSQILADFQKEYPSLASAAQIAPTAAAQVTPVPQNETTAGAEGEAASITPTQQGSAPNGLTTAPDASQGADAASAAGTAGSPTTAATPEDRVPTTAN